MLTARNLSYGVEDKIIIENISFKVKEGSFIGVVGPNGSGKSTLLKNIYKAVEGKGDIHLKGRKLKAVSNRELAMEMAVVSQHGSSDFDFTVNEMVITGRYPHKGIFKTYDERDRKIVKDAIVNLGLEGMSDRKFFTLSGGERQRVLIARALAQEADIIVLDEPTNHLDIRYQLQIMEILKRLNVTVVAAVHDMNIASLYCDEIIALKDGRIWAAGETEKVLSETFFKEVFQVEVEIQKNTQTNRLSIIYLPEKIFA